MRTLGVFVEDFLITNSSIVKDLVFFLCKCKKMLANLYDIFIFV